jgi:hypothetical protein
MPYRVRDDPIKSWVATLRGLSQPMLQAQIDKMLQIGPGRALVRLRRKSDHPVGNGIRRFLLASTSLMLQAAAMAPGSMRLPTKEYVDDSIPDKCGQRQKDGGAQDREDSRNTQAMDSQTATAQVVPFGWAP